MTTPVAYLVQVSPTTEQLMPEVHFRVNRNAYLGCKVQPLGPVGEAFVVEPNVIEMEKPSEG